MKRKCLVCKEERDDREGKWITFELIDKLKSNKARLIICPNCKIEGAKRIKALGYVFGEDFRDETPFLTKGVQLKEKQ